MSSLREKLRHAFAVDPPGPAEPTAEEKEVVDRFCQWVARRHLTTPGLVGLEMSRPLNWIAGQVMHFFSPGVWAVTPEQVHEKYKLLAGFLERRGSFEYIAHRLEHFEQEYEKREKEQRSKPDPDT